jgi:hypothetical protein
MRAWRGDGRGQSLVGSEIQQRRESEYGSELHIVNYDGAESVGRKPMFDSER